MPAIIQDGFQHTIRNTTYQHILCFTSVWNSILNDDKDGACLPSFRMDFQTEVRGNELSPGVASLCTSLLRGSMMYEVERVL